MERTLWLEMNCRTFLTWALLGFCAHSFAGPTYLLGIPTADLLGNQKFAYTLGVTGTERCVSKRWPCNQGFAVGLYDILELGLCNDFTGRSDMTVRLKILGDEKDDKWAIAIGAESWNLGEESFHLMARYDFGWATFHAGWQRDCISRFMFGVEAPLTENLGLVLDYASGGDGITWAGLSWSLPKLDQVSFMAGLGKPNARGERLLFQASVTWEIPLGKG